MSKAWDGLRKKLLAVGGKQVEEPDGVPASRLLRRGRLFRQPVRMRRGERHACHRKPAGGWAQDVARYTLCSGYGLADGRWLTHSWVLDGEVIVETTYRMEAYYGVAYSSREACDSWYWNFLRQRHPGPSMLLQSLFAA